MRSTIVSSLVAIDRRISWFLLCKAESHSERSAEVWISEAFGGAAEQWCEHKVIFSYMYVYLATVSYEELIFVARR
jgi:hypothetical protein